MPSDLRSDLNAESIVYQVAPPALPTRASLTVDELGGLAPPSDDPLPEEERWRRRVRWLRRHAASIAGACGDAWDPIFEATYCLL